MDIRSGPYAQCADVAGYLPERKLFEVRRRTPSAEARDPAFTARSSWNSLTAAGGVSPNQLRNFVRAG